MNSINRVAVGNLTGAISTDKVTGVELTPARGGTSSYTSLFCGVKTDSEINSIAKFYLETVLAQHKVVVGDVVFTPSDTIQGIDEVIQPVYVHLVKEREPDSGEVEYQFETHFKLKGNVQ